MWDRGQYRKIVMHTVRPNMEDSIAKGPALRKLQRGDGIGG